MIAPMSYCPIRYMVKGKRLVRRLGVEQKVDLCWAEACDREHAVQGRWNDTARRSMVVVRNQQDQSGCFLLRGAVSAPQSAEPVRTRKRREQSAVQLGSPGRRCDGG